MNILQGQRQPRHCDPSARDGLEPVSQHRDRAVAVCFGCGPTNSSRFEGMNDGTDGCS